MLTISQFAAIAVGAFYVFAGVVVMRAMALDRVMDQLLAALNESSAAKEQMRSRVLSVGAYLTLAGGAALMLLSPFAAPVFAINALWQGGYLMWAEKALPPEDESDALGRRQTKNAFVIYLAATAFVMWLAAQGLLRPWGVPLETLALDAGIVAVVMAGAWFYLNRPARKQSGDAFGDIEAPDDAAQVESEPPVTRVRLAPAWGCSPLLNADTGEPVNPAWLDIDYELADRIERWDDTWQATYNADDPASGGFKDEMARAAYVAEGRELVAALRAQWRGELVEVVEEFR